MTINSFAVDNEKDALALLQLPEDVLFARANALRKARFANRIELCAIINARSGNCGMDCTFCSQSAHNRTAINRFAFISDQVLTERINRLADLGVGHIGIVTSGGALDAELVEHLGIFFSTLQPALRRKICCSLGRLNREQLQYLHNCGLTRFHHNLESSSSFYPELCSTQTWEQRRQTVLAAAASGLDICCGGIFGTGESWAERIRFAFELRALGINNVPINFLHPQANTPLSGLPLLEPAEALKIIAIFRHILPNATLRLCGGRPETLRERQKDIFRAGANAIMTGDYLTTSGAAFASDLALIRDNGMQAG